MSEIIQDTKQRGFVPLDQIIRSALMDIGAPMSRYEQMRHWGIECMRELHFDLFQEIKTVQLSLTAWKAISLPTDYVDWVMLGVVVDNQIRVFTHDNRISLYNDDTDGTPEDRVAPEVHPADEVSINTLWFWNTNFRGEDTGGLFGLTVKDNGVGYYKMNPERREIQFSASIDGNTPIYMEYISDGYNPCEKTVVNLYAALLIKLYIHWQRLKFSKSPRSVVEEARREYFNQYYKVQSRILKITVEDVLDCARNGYRLIQSF